MLMAGEMMRLLLRSLTRNLLKKGVILRRGPWTTMLMLKVERYV
jgi:hypothetical protein